MSINDQLQTRIKELEERNKSIRELIHRNKLKLDQYELQSNNKTASLNSFSNKKKHIKESSEEHINTLNKLVKNQISSKNSEEDNELSSNNLNLLKKKSSIINLNERIIDIKICFSSNENYNSLYILGDFTNWEPKQMTKSKNSFIFNTLLLKNYKYYYYFSSKNESYIIDNSIYYEMNIYNSQVNNCIFTGNIQNCVLFEFKDMYSELNEARKEYISMKIDSNDYSILKSVHETCIDINDKLKEILKVKEKHVSLLTDHIKSKYIRKDSISYIDSYIESLKERVFMYNNRLYMNNGIDIDNGKVKCIMLYDENGISIDKEYYLRRGYYSSLNIIIFILEANKEKENNNQNAYFLTDSQYNTALDNILNRKLQDDDNVKSISNNNTQSRLHIQYRMVKADQSIENINQFGNVYYKSFLKPEIITIKKSNQECLNIDNYQIHISDGSIVFVTNKADNIRVLYDLELVRENENIYDIEIISGFNSVTKSYLLIGLKDLTNSINVNDSMMEIDNIDESLKKQNKYMTNIIEVISSDSEEEIGNNKSNRIIIIINQQKNKIKKVLYCSDNKHEEVKYKETRIHVGSFVFFESKSYPFFGKSICKIDSFLNEVLLEKQSFSIKDFQEMNVKLKLLMMIDQNNKYLDGYSVNADFKDVGIISHSDEIKYTEILFQIDTTDLDNYNLYIVFHKLHDMMMSLFDLIEEERIEFIEKNKKYIILIEDFLQKWELWCEIDKLEELSSLFAGF